MVSKQELRQLVDELPEELPSVAAGEAKRALELLHTLTGDDPFLRALANAPLDDEPLTAEDIAAIAEARQDIADGYVFSWEDLARELSLDPGA